MDYQNMVGSWNGFLKRSSFVVHIICFVAGLLAFLSILSYPYIASPNPGGAEVLGALLGGLVSFALINALGTAYRYCVWGDIRLFPRRTLAAYFAKGAEPAKNAEDVETAQPQAAEANEASASASLELPADSTANGEGVSGAWDAVVASDAFGSIPVTLKLVQQGPELTGTVEGSMFQPIPIEEGAIADGRATWKASATDPTPFTLVFDARFDGYRMQGEADFGQYGSGSITGARSAGEASAGEALGEAVPLESRRWKTVPPEEISEELMPVVEELGLVENCRQLADEGWTVIQDAADPEFIARLRRAIFEHTPINGAENSTTDSLLEKDPVFGEAAINPKLMAVAEFSLGRGFLLGSVVSTIRAGSSPGLEMHSDQAYFPEPFPNHNMMLTCCWVTEDFVAENGPTAVVSGSHRHLRHPTEEEVAARTDLEPVECPAGSVVLWDGRVWHANAAKASEGQRVVLHTTYQRMVVRPNEDYTGVADDLIERYGPPMSQLMGREDSIGVKQFDYVKNYAIFVRTTNNGKT